MLYLCFLQIFREMEIPTTDQKLFIDWFSTVSPFDCNSPNPNNQFGHFQLHWQPRAWRQKMLVEGWWCEVCKVTSLD